MNAPRTLVIIRGRGTAHERRIATTIPLYWSPALQRWVTIPPKRTWTRFY